MRLGIITNMITPYRTPIYERLAARPGCDVLVVYETTAEPNRQWEVGEPLRFPHTVLRSTTLDLRRLAPDAFVHLPRRPLEELRRFGAEAVVASGGGIWSSPANVAALAVRRFGGWALVPSWESFPHVRASLPRRMADPWVRAFMRAGDAWLGWGSRATRDVVRLGADPHRTVTVPQVAVPVSAQKGIQQPRHGGPVFLFVGQLLERKGVRVLLRAIDEVHDAQLWIAGDGPLRAEVEAKAASSSRVVYHGHLGQEELHHLYTYATALVLPSLYEVWGLVVNEALDHGIPAVVTDQVGAADDLIEDGLTGYCVRAGSVTELADAMKQVAAWSQKQRHACSRRGAELLSAYTFEAVASGIFEACKLGIEHRARSCSHSRTRR